MTTEQDYPLAGVIAELQDKELLERAEVEDLIFEYDRWRAMANEAKTEQDKAGERIKQWLNLHPDEEALRNGERGLKAFWQTKRAPRAIDLNAMAEQDVPLLAQLIKNGCLKHDEDAIKRAGALVGGVERYLTPFGETRSLQVVKD